MFEERIPHPDHYSAPLRRHLLLAIIIFMWIMLVDSELLFIYLFIGVPGVLIVAILASVTEPKNNYIIIVDTIVSAILFLIFEYYAVISFQYVGTIWNIVFILRQVMAIILLSSFYLALRDLREYKLQKHSHVS